MKTVRKQSSNPRGGTAWKTYSVHEPMGDSRYMTELRCAQGFVDTTIIKKTLKIERRKLHNYDNPYYLSNPTLCH